MRAFYSVSETEIAGSLLEETPEFAPQEPEPYLPDERSAAPADVGVVAATVLTAVAFVIHGYHPYADDGGIYLIGIKKTLNPALYPYWSEFALEFARFSLFARCVALFTHISALNLMTVMMLIYVVSIWMTLFAAWRIAACCWNSRAGCYGAVSLLALCFTMPVAGTSLVLMDPYVTARSISMPCSLFAMALFLESMQIYRQQGRLPWRRLCLCAASLAIAAMIHPLMAAYAMGCVILLACSSLAHGRRRAGAILAVCLFSIAAAACVYGLTPAPTPEYAQVAQARTYWFLDCWHWYEQFGMIAPLALLAAALLPADTDRSAPGPALAQMAIAAGVIALIVAMLFTRTSSASYAIARLQPMRIYQMVYVVMILAIGEFAGRRVLKRHYWRWTMLVFLVGGSMLFVQMRTFPDSAHIEFPWESPGSFSPGSASSGNGWEQGFVWIRNHTPNDAVSALDADYITAAGEDAQNFSAIAERSALPDYAKDGGIATMAPRLAGEWIYGEAAQKNLNEETDAQRENRLRSSVEWFVVSRSTKTDFPCVYRNNAIQVCRLPRH